ncbi:MAG: hypothetical protein ACLSHU_10865 [Oscillospiraceae bacterium]
MGFWGDLYTLYGPGWIEDTLCGLTFRLSPRSFYQVNHDQAERLYELAIAGAENPENRHRPDLYMRRGHHHPWPWRKPQAGSSVWRWNPRL